MDVLDLSMDNPAQTRALGRKLGAALFPGAVVGLSGPLGAGKTFLVRSVAEGLGVVEPRMVSSPTFVLIQEYEARLPIYHFDVYRLRSPREFSALGIEEYLGSGGVCLVEWADRVQEWLPEEHLALSFLVTGENSRRITIAGTGPLYGPILNMLENEFGAGGTPCPGADDAGP